MPKSKKLFQFVALLLLPTFLLSNIAQPSLGIAKQITYKQLSPSTIFQQERYKRYQMVLEVMLQSKGERPLAIEKALKELAPKEAGQHLSWEDIAKILHDKTSQVDQQLLAWWLKFVGRNDLVLDLNSHKHAITLANHAVSSQHLCLIIKDLQQVVGKKVLRNNHSIAMAELFKRTQVMKGQYATEKRSLFYYILRNPEYEPYTTNGEVHFKGIRGVSINIETGLVITNPHLLEGLQTIGQGRIFADMDDNLAIREEDMPEEMLEPLYHLTLYGLLPIEIVTDNEFKKAGMRLNQLPEWVKNMVTVYADGSGNQYVVDPATLKIKSVDEYRLKAGSFIDAQDYDDIYDLLYKDFIHSWEPFLLNTARHFNPYLANKDFPQKKDIPKIFTEFRASGKWIPQLEEIISLLTKAGFDIKDTEELIEHLWQCLNHDLSFIPESQRFSEEDYEIAKKDYLGSIENTIFKALGEDGVFQFYQIVAVIEMIRILNSEHHRDDKQRNDLQKNFLTLNKKGYPAKDGVLDTSLRDHVQIALKAIRPRIVRDMLGLYFEKKFKAKGEKLNDEYFLYTGGSTTINIKRKGVSKGTPITFAIENEDEKAPLVIFGGNEMLFPEDPEDHHTPDDAVAMLQLQEKYRDILVFNTADREHDTKRRPNLIWTSNLDLCAGKYGPQANSVLHNEILTIIEAEIESLLHDPFHEATPAIKIFRERIKKSIEEEKPAEKEEEITLWEKIKNIGMRTWNAFSQTILTLLSSKEYAFMIKEFRDCLQPGVLNQGEYIFDTICKKAKRKFGRRFDKDKADFAIIEIKKAIPKLISGSVRPETARERINKVLTAQANQYLEKVNGFGTIDFDTKKDTEDSLAVKEDTLEDIWFASMQAIDALGMIGDPSAINFLDQLSRKGFAAHRDTKQLDHMFNQVNLLKSQGELKEAKQAEMQASATYESVRRWTCMQSMFIKTIANLGNNCIGERGEIMSHLKEQHYMANKLLLDVLGNHSATGEGWYWLRQQAAYRLKDFDTEETIDILNRVNADDTPEGQLPNKDSCYIAMNLDAANKNAISVKLQSGMSAIHIYRSRAYKQAKNRDRSLGEDLLFKEEYRFARVLGILDALIDPTVDEEARIDTLKELAQGAEQQESAMAANVTLGALEELLGVQYEHPLLPAEDKQVMITERVQKEAFKAYKLIAKAVGENLKAENPKLYDEYMHKLLVLESDNAEELKLFAALTHTILGNLHRLKEMKTFKEGAEYLNIDHYRIIIESGGGASVAMAGVINRMTTDRALAIISGTDNGGGTLLSRAFDATKKHIMSPAQGDIVRFDMEAAVMEAAPAAMVIQKLMGNRGWSGDKTLSESLDLLYENSRKQAEQSGQEEAFKKAFAKIKKYAKAVDDMGLTPVGNTLRNLMFVGIMRETKGSGQEFMNPDGMYAALIEFRNLVGAKSFAVLDTPFGNEMIITGKDGQEYIGQSYYSHTPHGNGRGRQRAVSGMADIDTYYPAVAIHSRVASVLEKAKFILSGLCSWGTSLAILLKNKLLVNAQAKNKKGDKLLVTNAVKDDEIRGLTWEQSMTEFTEAMAEKPLQELWNLLLANSNEGIEKRSILAARPEFGPEIGAFQGEFGGYCGVNTPSQEAIQKIVEKGIRVLVDKHMLKVGLTPRRDNPDEYNASILMIAEKFAAGVWELLSEENKTDMGEPEVFKLITKHRDIEELLQSRGLSWSHFGIESIHELVIPRNKWLLDELQEWLYKGKVPEWIENKKANETWYQYPLRVAIDKALSADQDIKAFEYESASIIPDSIVPIAQLKNLNISVQFISGTQTNKVFTDSRTDKNEGVRQKEEAHRLGKISKKGNEITITLPKDLWLLGQNPLERMNYIEAALQFHLLKIKEWKKYWDTNTRVTEYTIQQKTLSDLKTQVEEQNEESAKLLLDTLGKLSVAVPYLRFLRVASSRDYTPVTMFDMDGTFTAAGTKLDRDMAYLAWKFFKSNQTIKEVITAQAYEGPLKQIIEEVTQIEHIMEWTEVRTGVSRKTKGLDSVYSDTLIGASSGNAIFTWNENEQGHKKAWQNPMKPVTTKLIEIAARCTMPEIPYGVEGHQIEPREPEVEVKFDEKGRRIFNYLGYAAVAVLPSGRFDQVRGYDPHKIVRIKQGAQMENLLEDPDDLLDQVKELIETRTPIDQWTMTITGKDGKKTKQEILPEQVEKITELYSEIIKKHAREIPRSIKISIQPGGATTNDVSPTGKDVGIAKGLEQVSKYTKKPLSQFRIAFFGDEMCTFILQDEQGEELRASGNDLAAAEHPHSQVELLTHVGETGDNVQLKENTTHAFKTKGTQPVDNLNVLNACTHALEQGSVVKLVLRNKGFLEDKLAELGFTWKSFGISTIEKTYEYQAQEILVICSNTIARALKEDLKALLSKNMDNNTQQILSAIQKILDKEEHSLLTDNTKQNIVREVLTETHWFERLNTMWQSSAQEGQLTPDDIFTENMLNQIPFELLLFLHELIIGKKIDDKFENIAESDKKALAIEIIAEIQKMKVDNVLDIDDFKNQSHIKTQIRSAA